VSPYPSGAGSVHREGCSTGDFQDRSEKNGIDARVEGIDACVEKIGACVEGIDARVEEIDACVEGIDARVEGIDARGGHSPRCRARSCACGGWRSPEQDGRDPRRFRTFASGVRTSEVGHRPIGPRKERVIATTRRFEPRTRRSRDDRTSSEHSTQEPQIRNDGGRI